ncbi:MULTISPECIES: hypothetical protein [unclassified Streptomyces]|uniref:hypothetical protein n=1 Tax=unclassified Streptomyces TaxID=2593676 RepID=UPI00344AA549
MRGLPGVARVLALPRALPLLGAPGVFGVLRVEQGDQFVGQLQVQGVVGRLPR